MGERGKLVNAKLKLYSTVKNVLRGYDSQELGKFLCTVSQ